MQSVASFERLPENTILPKMQEQLDFTSCGDPTTRNLVSETPSGPFAAPNDMG
jgi:hypothetical protein